VTAAGFGWLAASLYDHDVMVCRLRLGVLFLLVASLALTALPPWHAAQSADRPASPTAQTSPAAKPSVATALSPWESSSAAKAGQPDIPDDRAVIGFLSQVLTWHRWLSVEQEWVQEPAEVLFFSADRQSASQVVSLAFQYAKAQAAVIAGKPAAKAVGTGAGAASPDTEVLRAQAEVQRLQLALASAARRDRDRLNQQLAAAQSELELANTRAYFVDTMNRFESEGRTPADRLAAQIEELQKSVTPLQNGNSGGTAPGAIEQVSRPTGASSSGILANAATWLELRNKAFDVGRRGDYTAQMMRLFDSTGAVLQTRISELESRAREIGSKAAAPASTSALIAQRKQEFEQILAQRKLLTDAAIPLEKGEVLLKRYGANLELWHQAVEQREYTVFRGLISRLIAFALTLLAIFGAGWLWRRAAIHYVTDIHRRQLLLKLRSFVIGTLFVVVLLLTFVSELGSLATVIGFGAAGVAVALQDVILSVAGYFRISGRFGIKVGDWVEIQAVRGEVVDIGLTRLTLVELDGEGGERGATGRVVVIPNSAVFREKFINRSYGSYFTWAELRLTIAPECDYRLAEKRIVDVIDEVFAKYREVARRESQEIERRLNLRVEPPKPHSRIRLTAGGIEITVRYPVDARNQSSVADEISRRLLDSLSREPGLRLVPQGVPSIQAALIPPPAPEPGTVIVETPPESLVRRAKA
jgi:small-conductance mechanosensitive channel